ncbi:hypothetical protein V8D89_000314 [Ganoderma adspersum]
MAAFATTVALYAMAATYTLSELVTVFHNTRILDRDDKFNIPTVDYISTAVLTITTLLSNAVLWSRVWVLWGHNKALYRVSLMLIMITLFLGRFSTSELPGGPTSRRTTLSCGLEASPHWGSVTGVALRWISMTTNTLAFILYFVTVKVLEMRPQKSLSAGRRVARHFVRILESGAPFVGILLLTVVFNMGGADPPLTGTEGFSFFVNGALISLLGACAALVIFLAGTGYSETMFLDHAPDDKQGMQLSREAAVAAQHVRGVGFRHGAMIYDIRTFTNGLLMINPNSGDNC